MRSEIFMAAVVFFAIYHIIKNITDFLLKRKLIKENQVDKAGALVQFGSSNGEKNTYPTLKWGLVALFGGLGFIVIEVLNSSMRFDINAHNSFMTPGILLVFISLGFLTYFFIAKRKENQ